VSLGHAALVSLGHAALVSLGNASLVSLGNASLVPFGNTSLVPFRRTFRSAGIQSLFQAFVATGFPALSVSHAARFRFSGGDERGDALVRFAKRSLTGVGNSAIALGIRRRVKVVQNGLRLARHLIADMLSRCVKRSLKLWVKGHKHMLRGAGTARKRHVR
jgi:hypothetical protein